MLIRVMLVLKVPSCRSLHFPARSVTFAVIEWDPSARAEDVILQLPDPSAVVLPIWEAPSNSVTVPPASAVPAKVGVVSFVMLSVLKVPVSVPAVKSGADGANGAVVSIFTLKGEDAALVAGPTVAFTVILWVPSDNVELVILQVPPVAVADPSTVVPSVS